ncbi:MAG: hypothetical protein AAFY60_22600, partial [Myxococcota bacterium]
MQKSKLADRAYGESPGPARPTKTSQFLSPEMPSFRKNKKTDRIEGIEDGGRVLNRQTSRSTRNMSVKRSQTRSVERSFLSLKSNSSRLMPS